MTTKKLADSKRQGSVLKVSEVRSVSCSNKSIISKSSFYPHSLDGFVGLLGFLPSTITPSPDPASNAGACPGAGINDSSPENRLSKLA